MIDSHVHLDDPRFDSDREDVMQRAREAGVEAFVVPGTTVPSWSRIDALAERECGIHPAYGLHPWFIARHEIRDIEWLDQWLDAHPAVAVGECGLDFYDSDADREAQIRLFREQIALARQRRLPLIVHARKSLDVVLHELRRQPGIEGVLHSFSGSLQQAHQAIDLGMKLGIAATVAHERAQKLRHVVASVEEEALLIETDAPDQPGPAHRGERNEPAFLREHLAVIASLRGQSEETMADRLDANCRALFKLEETT